MSDRELTVREIIEDLQTVDQELHAYERKYRLVLQRDFVILRSEATKNLVLRWRIADQERDSSLPLVAQNDTESRNLVVVLASAVFYELYRQGKLDNGGYELTEDLGMWAGAYEIKLDRERRFLELSREYVNSVKTEGDKFVGQLHLYSNLSQTVILRSGATKPALSPVEGNLVLSMHKRDSSLPSVAQNDKFAKHQDKCDCPNKFDAIPTL